MPYPFELSDGKIVDLCRKCGEEFVIEYDDEKAECKIVKPCKCGECEG